MHALTHAHRHTLVTANVETTYVWYYWTYLLKDPDEKAQHNEQVEVVRPRRHEQKEATCACARQESSFAAKLVGDWRHTRGSYEHAKNERHLCRFAAVGYVTHQVPLAAKQLYCESVIIHHKRVN